MAELNLGTVYDFNKNAMSQFKPMDVIIFNKTTSKIAKEMTEAAELHDKHYWMLLCHELRDYTVFNIIAAESEKYVVNEIRPTLLNRGSVLDIEEQGNGAYEIWIRNENKENFAYYLFPYDNGVIEVNE